METRTAYIALGSNVGQRARTLLAALKRLDEIDGIAVRRVSRFVETEPQGGPAGQGTYLNAAARVETFVPSLISNLPFM